MRKLICVAAVLFLLALPIFAQDAPKAEFFGGYQYTRVNPGSGLSGLNYNGWNAAVTGFMGSSKTFGITGDISGAYKKIGGVSTSDHFFLFGPTIKGHGSISPFAHTLFGLSHASGGGASDNAFAWALGAGLDVKVASHVDVRLGQFDYLMTRHASETQNNFRYSAGIVFRFE